MKKKPVKVEETKGVYAEKKPAKTIKAKPSSAKSTGVRYIDDATFKKSMTKVFEVHDELFRRLAQ